MTRISRGAGCRAPSARRHNRKSSGRLRVHSATDIVGAVTGSTGSSVRSSEANIVSMVGTCPANKCSRSTRLEMESACFATIASTNPDVASRSPTKGTSCQPHGTSFQVSSA